MKLKDINFGSSDGQNEAKEQNFSEMFYEDGGHYTELRDTRKYIVVGRKGTGKQHWQLMPFYKLPKIRTIYLSNYLQMILFRKNY
ncbi:hypothetical protein AAFF39_03605 [Lactococcus garvieae]